VKGEQRKTQGNLRQEQQIRLGQQLSRESILLSVILRNFYSEQLISRHCGFLAHAFLEEGLCRSVLLFWRHG